MGYIKETFIYLAILNLYRRQTYKLVGRCFKLNEWEEDEEFIDIHKKEKFFQNKLKKLQTDKNLSEKNREIILRYLKESELGKTIKKGQKKKIGPGRNLQVAGWLNLMTQWFKKDLDKVTEKDMEKIVYDLDKGIIKSRYHKPYSSEGKSNIKKFFRKFYKWLLGENKYYPESVEWIDTSKIDTIVQAIPKLKVGVEMIVELIPDIRRKALVMVSFDSGFREGEILNCRVEDVEKDNDGIYYLTCKYSKTKPRTVSLPYSSELLDRWLKQHPKKDNPKAQLWQTSRVMFYKTVKLYGKKAHNKNITVHMIRHTSASFYAPKLDRVNFCKRYGWSYNSSSPDRYIDFAKISQKKVIDVVKAEKYQEMKQELDGQKAKVQEMKDKFSEQQDQLTHMNKILEALALEKKLKKTAV